MLRHLTKTFGRVRANDNICLSFAAGNIHGILGENGAGKSTLMKMLAGFLWRDAGEIVLAGQPVTFASPASALRAGVGMVYQDPLDVPAFTALENFFCASPRGVFASRAAARARLSDLAERLGFSVVPHTPAALLAVGQRQQLEIMRLLAWGARVLILDEPTTGISAAQKGALFAALRLLAEEGRTVLFVSHKLDEIAELCDTASVLRAGRVAGEGQMTLPHPREHLLALMFGAEVAGEEAAAPSLTAPSSTPSTAAEPPAHPVWHLEHVSLCEGSLVLRDITLEIGAGKVVGLAGVVGSGQQAFLRLLAGVHRPEAGRLLLNGADMTTASRRTFQQQGVHYLPADRLSEGVIGELSLASHLALLDHSSPLLMRREREVAHKAAQAIINEYGIHATPTTRLENLSGGNQQRAMLALLPDHCTGLLLEQPTRGLDVASARAIWRRLLARRAAGTALVFSSVDLDELLTCSDEIAIFYGGQVVAPLPRAQLDTHRLAKLISGVGVEEAREVSAP